MKTLGRVLGPGLLAAMTSLSWGIAASQDDRAKVPAPDAQKEALKVIREVFKQEFAQRPGTARLALAQKLQQQGLETKDDPVTQYTLLVEARDLFLEGGETDRAMNAIHLLGTRFLIESGAMKLAALGSAARSAKTPQEQASLARTCLSLLDETFAEADFETAVKFAELASTSAKKAKDFQLTGRAQVRSKEASELRTKFERLRQAREMLQANSEDPPSSALVGRHECLIRGNWEVGIPLLAKGSDEAIRSLARSDLASPKSPADQLAVGDGWWNLADSESATARFQLRGRALYWYEKCAPGLTGLNQARVSQRLGVLRGEHLLSHGDWVDCTNPALFGYSGKPGDPVQVTPKPGTSSTVKLREFPTGEIDGLNIRVHCETGSFGLAVFERDSTAVWVDGPNLFFQVAYRTGGTNWKPYLEQKLERADDCWVTILIQEGNYVVYREGQEVYRLKTDASAITSLSLIANAGPVRFDDLKFRRRH